MLNRKINYSIASVLFGLLLLAPAYQASAAEPGWYGGFGFGESEVKDTGSLDNLCSSVGVTCNDSETDSAWQAIIGYQFNDYMGIEGAYFDLGGPSVSLSSLIPASASAKVSGLSISALPQIPIGSFAALYGRLGIAAGNGEIRADIPSLGLSESESDTGATLLYGLGASINLGQSVALRAEWARYDFDQTLRIANSDISVPNIEVVSAAIIFRF